MTGGPWVRARARTLLAAALAAAALAGTACAGSIDQARSVSTRLNRLDTVASAQAVVATAARAARIDLALEPGLTAEDVVATLARTAEVARAAGYAPYRVRLTEGSGDAMVVDEGFERGAGATEQVLRWRTVGRAMLGSVTMTVGRRTTVLVDAGPALLRDVTEASRTTATGPRTTWDLRGGGHAVEVAVEVAGRVARSDAAAAKVLLRGLGSPSLPVPAAGWRWERYAGRAVLDVTVAADAVPAARVTPATSGRELEPLATAALAAVASRGPGTVVRLLRAGPGDAGVPDVLGWWSSDHPPLPGRDPLDRGWDRWLARLAGSL